MAALTHVACTDDGDRFDAPLVFYQVQALQPGDMRLGRKLRVQGL